MLDDDDMHVLGVVRRSLKVKLTVVVGLVTVDPPQIGLQ